MRELERADLILHAGDVTAASVLRELEACAPVEAVFGNMDEPVLRDELPERRSQIMSQWSAERFVPPHSG